MLTKLSVEQSLVAPISTKQPVGVDIRYDDDFEFIEDELAKQGSLTDRGQINWDKVAQAATDLLANKSKDLKVSCYLIRAWYEQEGFKGLASGMRVNLLLLENYWDDMFPKRVKARSNAYEWLSSKFETVLQNMEVPKEQLQYIEQAYDAVQKVEQFLQLKLAHKAPVLGYFRRSLNELSKTGENQAATISAQQQTNPTTLSEQKLAQKPNSAQQRKVADKPEQSAPPVSTDISNSTAISVNDAQRKFNDIDSMAAKDRNKIIRQCHDVMRNLSMWSLKENLDSSSAYAMNRFATWMGITQLPVHDNKVTPLKPLPKDKINNYNNLFETGSYAELIPQVELSFSKSPFWLDAHRLVAHALEALNMQDAAKTVKDHTALFIKRFPEIIEFKFSDNSDFADVQTRQWIYTQLLTPDGNDNMPETDLDEDDDYSDILAQVRELSQKSRIKEAVQLFNKQIVQQGSIKKQTYWKYHLAKFCFENGIYKLSLALLQEIDKLIKAHNLESWEPDLVKQVLFLFLACLKHLQPDSEYIKTGIINVVGKDSYAMADLCKERDELFSRLCHLDPALALEVG